MVDIHKEGHKPKEFLCPVHYAMENPPPTPEEIICRICLRPLEFMCPTCQSYVDEQKGHFDKLDVLKYNIGVSNTPLDTMSEPPVMTLEQWNEHQDGKFLNQDTYEKIHKILRETAHIPQEGDITPQSLLTDKHPWEFYWFILVNGWEQFIKWKRKKDTKIKEFQADWKKSYDERLEKERIEKERIEREKKEQEDREAKSKQLREEIEAVKVFIKARFQEILDKLRSDVKKLPIEVQMKPRAIIELLKQTINKVNSSTSFEIDLFEEFFDKLAVKNNSVLNTPELKETYRDIVQSFGAFLEKWRDFKTDYEALFEAERAKYQKTENTDFPNDDSLKMPFMPNLITNDLDDKSVYCLGSLEDDESLGGELRGKLNNVFHYLNDDLKVDNIRRKSRLVFVEDTFFSDNDEENDMFASGLIKIGIIFLNVDNNDKIGGGWSKTRSVLIVNNHEELHLVFEARTVNWVGRFLGGGGEATLDDTTEVEVMDFLVVADKFIIKKEE